MRFVFVDDTGDPGSDLSGGASAHFGMALLSVKSADYEAIRRLLSQVHWLSGTATSLALGQHSIRALMLLRGLQELSNNCIVSASSLYIDKKHYGGRYLTWSDVDVPSSEWAYYLRNYLLRHLLEFHFSVPGITDEVIDLVLDRILLDGSKRENTLNYLNSKTAIPLREPFKIPPITYLTIADSEYVGGLETAHVLADVTRELAKGTISQSVTEVANFIRVKHFVGHEKKA